MCDTTTKVAVSKETELAFQAHLAEYEAARNEILQRSELQNQLVNYIIAIVAGTMTLFAIGQPSIGTQLPILFLVASMLISAIGWVYMELEMGIIALGSYVQYVLSDKIQKLIGHEALPEYTVLKWEKTKSEITPHRIFAGLIWMGRTLITIVPGITFVVVFYSLRSSQVGPWTLSEMILFGMAIAMVMIHLTSVLLNARSNLSRGVMGPKFSKGSKDENQ